METKTTTKWTSKERKLEVEMRIVDDIRILISTLFYDQDKDRCIAVYDKLQDILKLYE